jgi:hypothetical protein
MSHHDGPTDQSTKAIVWGWSTLFYFWQAAADCTVCLVSEVTRPTQLYVGAYVKKGVDGSVEGRTCGKGSDESAADWRKVDVASMF